MDLTQYLLEQLAVRGTVTIKGTLGNSGAQLDIHVTDKWGRTFASNFSEFGDQLRELSEDSLTWEAPNADRNG